MDQFSAFKAMQREGWSHFAPLEVMTTMPAARLAAFAGIRKSQAVLDVACGTGVLAVTAARKGARVTGLDLTPELLERARQNSEIAGVDVEWHEGDVEALPFRDATFDAVLSQFGHIFAPRPEVALAEMLRVLKPGGAIAFSTWPPTLFVGRVFVLVGRYMPPTPGIAPPVDWGRREVILQRLGDAVRDAVFQEEVMLVPALSPQHRRIMSERNSGPLIKIVDALSASDPGRLAAFRNEYDALTAEFWHDNAIHQNYLMTRAIKK
jgi:ubiquinone/menaquinone biosynthesis C-methylase UbiE